MTLICVTQIGLRQNGKQVQHVFFFGLSRISSLQSQINHHLYRASLVRKTGKESHSYYYYHYFITLVKHSSLGIRLCLENIDDIWNSQTSERAIRNAMILNH